MKKLIILILASSFVIACTGNESSNKNLNDTSSTKKTVNLVDNLKDISHYKLGLLGSKISKAIEILGEPDDKGESNSSRSGHYVYYDKTKEDGVVKHFVVYYSYDNRYSDYQTIKQVDAIADGQNFYQQRYGSLTIKKPRGFGEELKDLDKTTINIQNQFKAIDTNKLSKLEGEKNGRERIFYYTDNLKLVMVKEPVYLEGGNIVTTTHFFINDEVKYITEKDSQGSFMFAEKIVVNNKVVRYLQDGKIGRCRIECDFDKYSHPYLLVDDFNKNWQGGD